MDDIVSSDAEVIPRLPGGPALPSAGRGWKGTLLIPQMPLMSTDDSCWHHRSVRLRDGLMGAGQRPHAGNAC